MKIEEWAEREMMKEIEREETRRMVEAGVSHILDTPEWMVETGVSRI